MDHELDIDELCQMEKELDGDACSIREPAHERNAKVNLLKFLQTGTVLKYEEAFDDLVYELNMREELKCLRRIEPVPADSGLMQPKAFQRSCHEDGELDNQIESYRKDATCAKVHLDMLVRDVVKVHKGCKGIYAEIKSAESTKRKATNFFGGDVRKVTDMARASVICEAPDDLENAYVDLKRCVEVRTPLNTQNSPIEHLRRLHRVGFALRQRLCYCEKYTYPNVRCTRKRSKTIGNDLFRDGHASWAGNLNRRFNGRWTHHGHCLIVPFRPRSHQDKEIM